MNEVLDFQARIDGIQRILGIGEYTTAATECVKLTEQALRCMVSQYIDQVSAKVKSDVQEATRKRVRGEGGIEKLTMGQMIYTLRDAKFLEDWARVTGKSLSGLRVIDLEKLTQLRNKFMHDGAEATRAEAEFLLQCLHFILETFDLYKPIKNRITAQIPANSEESATMEASLLPFAFHTRMVEFLLTLPNLDDSYAQRAFLNSAGLDPQLQQRIHVADPPSQFFHLLVPMLSQYGTLKDGRHALQAILEAAKAYVGKEGQAQCEELLRELQCLLAGKPSVAAQSEAKPASVSSSPAKPPVSAESLDTQILRVLAGYYQQHPGDPEMNIEDVLSALPQHQLPTIQAQLFALKKKGWIGYDLTSEGSAGLVWIEPKGIKIARLDSH
ncbi:hypothetical protein U27_00696 [Candidatus Vecturithrix granuli]|uniref:Effector-associated domain-containing protein n=1 Tax=Vecturithrix granuli TaxID=1499967 RepID=A0A081C893_VECG1|nr:hypothetical protein U27_00696 [Candidatus Vecturithrix granuli]